MCTFFFHNLISARKRFLVVLPISAVLALAVVTASVNVASGASGILTSSLNPSTFGQCVTFTFTPTTAPVQSSAPAGFLGFFDGNTLLGPGTFNPGPNNYTFTTCSLSVGHHTISVGGPQDFIASLDQLVNAAPAEVPEADTLLLFGGGIGGLATWLGWQFRKQRAKK